MDKCVTRVFDEAYSIVNGKIDDTCTSNNARYYQLAAEYQSFLNPTRAMDILLSARKKGLKLLRVGLGFQKQKDIAKASGQGAYFVEYLRNKGIDANDFMLRIGAILDDLTFGSKSSGRFEEAFKNLSFMIGIYSSRPDHDENVGPDNL